MSAAGHFLEDEGLATTGISLVREHTAGMRPPRALWVSFDLGRPFGLPNDPEFQTRVLRASLALLERKDGPVILDDYPEDAPAGEVDGDAMDGMVCPVPLRRPAEIDKSDDVALVMSEIGQLSPWYELRLRDNALTLAGSSGLELQAAVRFLGSLLNGSLDNPRAPDLTLGQLMRLAAQDIRNWHLEAAQARPGPVASARQLADWFWGETAAGNMLLKLRPVCKASTDASLKSAADLVPRVQQHRRTAGNDRPS